MYDVALVDTRDDSRDELAAALRGGGCHVVAFADWRRARDAMRAEHPDAVVLCDWRRRGGRGAHRYLLSPSRNAPFVLVTDTDQRGELRRFAAVLAYPVEPAALVATVEAVCEAGAGSMRLGRYSLSPRRRILWREGGRLHLTPVEVELLRVLITAEGAFVESRRLVEEAWGISTLLDKRVLYTHVAWLRRKLQDAFGADLIVSERKRGYRFDPDIG